MKEQLSQRFLTAFDHYKKMVQQHGQDHPLAEKAILLTLEYAPQWLKDEASQQAKQVLPQPSGYLDDGSPVYNIEEIAQKFGISVDQAEKQLAKILKQRKELGLNNDGLLLAPKTSVNRVQ